MLLCIRLLGCLLAFSAVLASAAAEAQSAAFRLQRSGRHASFSLQLGHAPAASAYLPGRVGCAPRPTWVPGHHEQVTRQVWVSGACRRQWVPPVYETRYGPCGQPVRVLVSCGYWASMQEPGHFEARCESEWVAGRWVFLRS